MTREQWKAYYRQYRIVRRETYKASTDMLLYGSGFVEIGPHVRDLIMHVPIDEILPRVSP